VYEIDVTAEVAVFEIFKILTDKAGATTLVDFGMAVAAMLVADANVTAAVLELSSAF
jgi:hypothetical protein